MSHPDRPKSPSEEAVELLECYGEKSSNNPFMELMKKLFSDHIHSTVQRSAVFSQLSDPKQPPRTWKLKGKDVEED